MLPEGEIGPTRKNDLRTCFSLLWLKGRVSGEFSKQEMHMMETTNRKLSKKIFSRDNGATF